MTQDFLLLSIDRRRIAVEYLGLFPTGTEIDTQHLARVVRAVELVESPARLDSSEYETAYVGLTQSHLPKLEEAGKIVYNDRLKQVLVTSETHALASLARAGREC